jgi:hypothetical protein
MLLVCGSGCWHSRADLPTDLEPLYQFVRYHSRACDEYPFSCPCCPYFDYQNYVWRDPTIGYVMPPQPVPTCCDKICDWPTWATCDP